MRSRMGRALALVAMVLIMGAGFDAFARSSTGDMFGDQQQETPPIPALQPPRADMVPKTAPLTGTPNDMFRAPKTNTAPYDMVHPTIRNQPPASGLYNWPEGQR